MQDNYLVQQKIIKSLLKSNYELISMGYAYLFTAGKNSKDWLFSELHGAICLVIDFVRKSTRFLMFDVITYEIVFENELYKHFNTTYSKANDLFQYFEVNEGL